jgi:hypothetical protein
MGFRKPELDAAYVSIRRCLTEIRSSYNDGFISEGCKHELYQLKCWLEDQYADLPTFSTEKDWEQERIVKILKQE